MSDEFPIESAVEVTDEVRATMKEELRAKIALENELRAELVAESEVPTVVPDTLKPEPVIHAASSNIELWVSAHYHNYALIIGLDDGTRESIMFSDNVYALDMSSAKSRQISEKLHASDGVGRDMFHVLNQPLDAMDVAGRAEQYRVLHEMRDLSGIKPLQAMVTADELAPHGIALLTADSSQLIAFIMSMKTLSIQKIEE